MQEVLIAGVATNGVESNDRLTETVQVNFAKVSLDYTPQDAKGTAIPFGWDIAANAQE
jgi:type VI secretion system secreted protein Hcp